MFGENALGVFKSGLKSRDDSLTRQDLEAKRALELKKLQQQMYTTGNEENRKQIKQNQADVKFNQAQDDRQATKQRNQDALEAQKKLIYNVNNDNWDNALKTSFNGDFNPLNRYLTDDTDDNPHKPIKTELEKGIGGKIIKIESGFGMEEAEVGDAKITFQRPNGEVVVDLMPMDEVGVITGSARRMGGQDFNDMLTKASINPKTGQLDLTKLYEMATIAKNNGDEKAKKVLKTLDSLNKKEGKGSFDIETLYGELDEAIKSGDMEKASSIMNRITAIKKAMSIGEEIDDKAKGKELTFKQKQDIKDGQMMEQLDADISSVAPSSINDDNIEEITGSVKKYISLVKGTKSKTDRASYAMDSFLANDAKKDVLNIMSDDLLSGRHSQTYSNSMRYLGILEEASDVRNTTPVVKEVGYLNGQGSLIKITQKVVDYYRNYKTPTYSVTDKTMNEARKIVGSIMDNKIMTLKSGREVALNKLSADVNDLYTIATAEKGVAKDGTKVTGEQIRTAKDKLHAITGMQFETQVFLVMKDLLKELSGSGVTNQELDSYRTKITGTDWTDSDGIMRNMLSSSQKAMSSYNTSVSNLIGMGAKYTAINKLQNLRTQTQGLRKEWGDTIYTNGLETDMLTDPRLMTEQGKEFFTKMTALNGVEKRNIKSLVNDVYRYKTNNGGKLKGYDINNNKIFSRMPKSKQEETLEILRTFIKSTPSSKDARDNIKPSQDIDKTQPPTLQGGTVEEYRDKRSDEDKTALQYLDRWETDGGDYKAKNPDSSAYGRFQVVDKTLKDILPKVDGGKWSKEDYKAYPLVQEKVMDELLKDYKKSLEVFGKPSTPENIYTMHQLGADIAKRFFNNSLTKSDLVIMWKNLPENTRALVPKGSKQVVSYWVQRYRGGKA